MEKREILQQFLKMSPRGKKKINSFLEDINQEVELICLEMEQKKFIGTLRQRVRRFWHNYGFRDSNGKFIKS